MSAEKFIIATKDYHFIISEVERMTGRTLDTKDSKWNDYVIKLLDAQNMVTKYTNHIFCWQGFVCFLVYILYLMNIPEGLSVKSFFSLMHSPLIYKFIIAIVIFNIILIMTESIIPSLLTLYSIQQESEFKNIFYRNLKLIKWRNCIYFIFVSTLMLWTLLPPL